MGTNNESLDLLIRMAARETAALGELYDRYNRLLFGLILRMLRDRRDAEEVLQDVFIQAWTRAATYSRDLGSPAGWLVGIARNRSIDRLRANAVRQRTLDAAPVPSAVETPEALAVLTDRQRQIQRALDALPRDQRELIERAYFTGLTQSEMAAQLDVPLGTIKTRVRTGLTTLRRLLQHTLVEQ